MKSFIDYLFIVYFSVIIDEKRFYKAILNTTTSKEAKDIFFKKIKKDLRGFLIKDVKVVKIKKCRYRGREITDEQWSILQSISYPNSRHKLKKIPKNQWFRPQKYKKRNPNGTFKKGFVPWNKNLKLKLYRKDENGKFINCRDVLGRFEKGIQVTAIGVKNNPHEKNNISRAIKQK